MLSLIETRQEGPGGEQPSRKITNGFFNFFETLIGRIKIGTQYGNSSLELLEKMARLRELGIITEEEFTKKKKKILDRI